MVIVDPAGLPKSSLVRAQVCSSSLIVKQAALKALEPLHRELTKQPLAGIATYHIAGHDVDVLAGIFKYMESGQLISLTVLDGDWEVNSFLTLLYLAARKWVLPGLRNAIVEYWKSQIKKDDLTTMEQKWASYQGLEKPHLPDLNVIYSRIQGQCRLKELCVDSILHLHPAHTRALITQGSLPGETTQALLFRKLELDVTSGPDAAFIERDYAEFVREEELAILAKIWGEAEVERSAKAEAEAEKEAGGGGDIEM
jgi:hypothetical protein